MGVRTGVRMGVRLGRWAVGAIRRWGGWGGIVVGGRGRGRGRRLGLASRSLFVLSAPLAKKS